MRRLLIAVFATLLAVALIAPAAQAATKTQVRYLEGKVEGGGRVQFAIKYVVRNAPPGSVHKKWILANGRKRFSPR